MKGTDYLPTVTGSRHAPKQYCLYSKKASIIFYPSGAVLRKNRRSCYEMTVAQGPSKAELRADGRSTHLILRIHHNYAIPKPELDMT